MLNRSQNTANKALNTSRDNIIRFLPTGVDDNLQYLHKGQDQSGKGKRSDMIFINPSNTSQAVIIIFTIIPGSTSSCDQKGKHIVKKYGHKNVGKDEEGEDAVISIDALFLDEVIICSELHCYYAYRPEDEEENG